MERRGFLAALAGLAVAGPKALDELARLAAPTDYNAWCLGLADIMTSTSLRGLNSSTYALWNVDYSDTSNALMRVS